MIEKMMSDGIFHKSAHVIKCQDPAVMVMRSSLLLSFLVCHVGVLRVPQTRRIGWIEINNRLDSKTVKRGK